MFFGLFRLQPHCDPLLAVIGFFVYLASYIIISVYLCWALLPGSLLQSIGLTYYPQKYWALLIPVWPCVLLLFLYAVVALQTIIRCPDLNDSRVYKDKHTNTSTVPREEQITMFEVFSISGHYVLHDGVKSLWCSKLDGKLVPSNSTILDDSLDPVCLGRCHGIVGKIKFLPESPDNLVLIADKEVVCKLHGVTVQRINEIVMLPLSLETPYLDLPACSKHTKPPKGENVTETDAKIERKLEEEFIKWFEKSFYYSEDGDITHTLTELHATPPDLAAPLWQRAKTEYFWNKDMLKSLISVYTQFPDLCNPWILPVMQGYIEQADITSGSNTSSKHTTASLTLISRRSKYRAGTRFKRRGIDLNGCPANYVVTEQILKFGEEELSFTIIRGSVPVYWYQPLTNYRPKPVILCTPEEALEAFTLHMDRLVATHGEIVVVNLLDSEGKEAPLGDEFAKVAYMYNNEKLTYVAFDFNEYCAGMKFDNVNVLLKELEGITQKFGYTHVVRGEIKRSQAGAVRVNCMDSLDRTNVVQGAIARHTLSNQAASVGITEGDLSSPGKLLWANNGDAISTQYAGTAALKGDYTRTGERGVAGMMRDGVSSVTRMYINLFRDTNRQAAIDIMQGLEPDLAEIRDEVKEELDCIPALLEQGQHLLPTQEDNRTHNIYKSWVTQDWPSGLAKGVWLTPKSLNIVHDPDNVDTLLLSTCDRLHIGQPPDCLGHYMRIINGRTHLTLRPLSLDASQLRDVLMKMAHSIVSCRDDLGLTTQVLHGPLAKADIVDMGFDKIRSSANSFGTKIAAGAKRMIGEARGVLDHTKSGDNSKLAPSDGGSDSNSPRNSPKFGKRMFNMFRRGEEVGSTPLSVRLSDLTHRNSTTQIDVDGATNSNTTTNLRQDFLSDAASDPIQSSDSTTIRIVRSSNNVDTKFVSLDKNPEIRSPDQHPDLNFVRSEAGGELPVVRSESDLDKIPRNLETKNLTKPRSTTLDSYNSFKNSRSHFIFFDRLTASFDSMSGTSRNELDGVSRES
ncbi:hypothetical protein ACHWQZ_G017949 [Mnemiopsis leidyi]